MRLNDSAWCPAMDRADWLFFVKYFYLTEKNDRDK